MATDLFGIKPRRPPRVLMHVADACDCSCGREEDLGKPMCQMECKRCGARTGWLIFDTVTEAKRGIPCERCNDPAAACEKPGEGAR